MSLQCSQCFNTWSGIWLMNRLVTGVIVLSERSKWPVSRAPIKLSQAIVLNSGGCEATDLWRGKTWGKTKKIWAARPWPPASQHTNEWCSEKVGVAHALNWLSTPLFSKILWNNCIHDLLMSPKVAPDVQIVWQPLPSVRVLRWAGNSSRVNPGLCLLCELDLAPVSPEAP